MTRIRNGVEVPDDRWVLELQQKFNDVLDLYEDKHQDAIDAVDRDFGSGKTNCDYRGFLPYLEPPLSPELVELEKEHILTPEERDNHNQLEEYRKRFREEEWEEFPHINESPA